VLVISLHPLPVTMRIAKQPPGISAADLIQFIMAANWVPQPCRDPPWGSRLAVRTALADGVVGNQAVLFKVERGQRLTISSFNTVSSAASCPVTASRRASSSRSPVLRPQLLRRPRRPQPLTQHSRHPVTPEITHPARRIPGQLLAGEGPARGPGVSA
jgi:hypothetical protein